MLQSEADPIRFGRTFVPFGRLQGAFPEGHGTGRGDRRLSRRRRAARNPSASPRRHAYLCEREHAADHAADADRLLAPACSAPSPKAKSPPTRPQAEKNASGSALPARRRMPSSSSCRCACEDLIGLSTRLHARILHLDQAHAEAPPISACRRMPSRSSRRCCGDVRRAARVADPEESACRSGAAHLGKESPAEAGLFDQTAIERPAGARYS